MFPCVGVGELVVGDAKCDASTSGVDSTITRTLGIGTCDIHFTVHTIHSFFIIKKRLVLQISLCCGLGLALVHQDFPFQSIREKEFQKRIKGMANSCFAVRLISNRDPA